MVLQRHPIYSGLSCRIFPKPFHIDMHPISLYTKAQLISHFTDISKYQTPYRWFTRTNLTGIIPFRNWLTHSWTNSQLRTAPLLIAKPVHMILCASSSTPYCIMLMSYPWLWTHIPTLVTYGRTSPNTFWAFPTLPNHFRPLPTLCELLRSFVNLGSLL